MNDRNLMNKAADNIRILAASMVEKAKSGHPGGAMGGADFINVLFSEFLVYDPENPTDPRTNIYAKYGRLVNGESGYQNTETSTLYLYNANYLKLKNLTFGYTLPRHISEKAYMENLRVYFSCENVFNITNYPGQDPELGASPEYTSLRQFAFGVNVTF